MTHIFRSINPYTTKQQNSYPTHTDEEMKKIMHLSLSSSLVWGKTDIALRLGLLRNLADQLRGESARYARLITEEMGKNIRESTAEVMKCALFCDHYANAILSGKEDLDFVTGTGNTGRQNLSLQGTLLAVMTWDYPFWQVFRTLVPTMVEGHVALLQHTPNVPTCAMAIELLFLKAGFSEGVLQSIRLPEDALPQLIDHEQVRSVAIMGSSVKKGKLVSHAMTLGKKVLNEKMQGHVFIVCDDADLNRTVSMAVKSMVCNAGQSRISAKHFFVMGGVIERFITRMRSAVQALRLGNPQDEVLDCGTLAMKGQQEQLHQQVHSAMGEGARCITGGYPLAGVGYYYAPTLLTEISEDTQAYKEEFIGPIAVIHKVCTLQDIIQHSNTSFADFYTSIWTEDDQVATTLTDALKSDCKYINSLPDYPHYVVLDYES